jgi:hypothetical protein
MNVEQFLTGTTGALLLFGYSAPVAMGFFCAYWAQQTQRNPWLWFFLGALLMPVAGIALLASRRNPDSSDPGEDLSRHIVVRKDVV